MNGQISKRIRSVQKMLSSKKDPSCLVVSSAPLVRRTGDQHYPFRQDSDFFYLTQSQLKDSALFISSNSAKIVLVVPPKDPVKALWDGPTENPKAVAKAINAELIVSPKPIEELLKLCRNHEHLFHSDIPESISGRLAERISRVPGHLRQALPRSLELTDRITEKLRAIKDPFELQAIDSASQVTIQAINMSLEMIAPSIPEYMVARTIDYWFGMNRGTPAFGTIVAAGKSAATLHHQSGAKKLTPGDLVLIDCGAEFELYNSDITRVFPVSGKFDPAQRALYEIVLEAQHRALSKIKSGVKIKAVYDAAAMTLTEGLVELRVLKGKARALFNNKAYKPYFPHGIGHSLGLDVHDIGKFRGNNEAVLSESMVFTVEPGLYFPKATKYLKPCGVRIEDTIFVTKAGCRSFTERFPKDPEEIESIVGR